MKKLLNQLLKDTYTVEELNRKFRLITTDTKAKGSDRPETKAISRRATLITTDIIEKLPIVVITLAVSLPEEEVRRLCKWFRRHVDPQILLDLRQNAKIIGGCQIIWRGFEEDFSLRKRFRENGS